ncbi:MAG: xanthine dehydrogenase family protein subunit M [Candidatus Binatia bacterium]
MKFRSADTIEEALDALQELGSTVQVLAGGTDVMIQLARRELQPETLLHIERLQALKSIQVDGTVRLGALVTHLRLAQGELPAGYAAIVEGARTVGGWQTQAVGTVGGNVCNASPAADIVPPLLVHDAAVTLRSRAGQRTLPLQKFILGRRSTARRPEELLTEIALAPPGQRTGDVYLKVGRRAAMEIAIVGLAARLAFDEAGTVSDARIAIASVAPSALRIPAAEAALRGRAPERDALGAAADAILESISPIDDIRATASYRRRVIPQLLRRAVDHCAERAGVQRKGV